MQFGIKTSPQHTTFQEMRDVWVAADDIELFRSAWNFDHFYPILVPDTSGPCLEAWVTLSALAEATSRIRIGTMVNGLPYRHPAVIANMAASLDLVSEGRLELGLGAGWNDEEADAYGIDLLPLKQRFDKFDEGVEVVARLLENETTSFDGTYYSLAEARCSPKGPQQPRPPIVIGGTGEKRTLRTAARWADHWNHPFADAADFARKVEVLRAHCAEVGRDFSEIHLSTQHNPGDNPPGAVAELAHELAEAGCHEFIVYLPTPHRAAALEPLAEALAPLA